MTPIEAMGEAISDALVSYVGSTLTPEEKSNAARAGLLALAKAKYPSNLARPNEMAFSFADEATFRAMLFSIAGQPDAD
jgi:hypothetical protein